MPRAASAAHAVGGSLFQVDQGDGLSTHGLPPAIPPSTRPQLCNKLLHNYRHTRRQSLSPTGYSSSCRSRRRVSISPRSLVTTSSTIGIDIIVLGPLHSDQTVDVEGTRELVELARPLEVTFHRAFDVSPNLEESLASVIQTGATRVLTAGARRAGIPPQPASARLRPDPGCSGLQLGYVRQAGYSGRVAQPTSRRQAGVGPVRRLWTPVSWEITQSPPLQTKHRRTKCGAGPMRPPAVVVAEVSAC